MDALASILGGVADYTKAYGINVEVFEVGYDFRGYVVRLSKPAIRKVHFDRWQVELHDIDLANLRREMTPDISNVLGGMIVDGVAASQGVDKSAERLIIQNCDLSSVEAGEATWIWEHKDSNGSTALDIIGTIRRAKKIYSEADCSDERESYWWDLVRQPIIYFVARLYNGAGHPGALAVAAQIRDHYANGEKIIVRNSIHGSTLERKGNELTTTIFRKLACTLTPCNQSCDTGVLDDPMLAKLQLQKREGEINVCAIALQCLPNQGPLLEDPGAQPYSPERAQELIEVTRRAWKDLKKNERPMPSVNRPLSKFHAHDASVGAGTMIFRAYEPARFSDDHLASFARASQEPRVRDLHEAAMEGWRRSRERLLAGDLRRLEVEHALRIAGLGLNATSQPGPLIAALQRSELAPETISGVHEILTRRRGDAAGAAEELGAAGDSRVALCLAHLGFSEVVPVDTALAQHYFALDDRQAEVPIAEGSQWATDRNHCDCCGIGSPLPASWLHWLAAPAHAQTVGLPAIAGDRSGFWQVTMPPNGGPFPPDQSSSLEAIWSKRFGDVGALILYYALLASQIT